MSGYESFRVRFSVTREHRLFVSRALEFQDRQLWPIVDPFSYQCCPFHGNDISENLHFAIIPVSLDAISSVTSEGIVRLSDETNFPPRSLTHCPLLRLGATSSDVRSTDAKLMTQTPGRIQG